jgi:general secretion pathway protein G
MQNSQKRDHKGFTILEIMAVVIIIGILASMVAMNVFSKVDDAKKKATKASLRVLDDAITQFKLDTGRFPTEEEGVKALVERPSDVTNYPEGGYLKTRTVPKDAWGSEFVYHLNPESGAPFEVMSYGADKEAGGEAGTPQEDLRSTDAE